MSQNDEVKAVDHDFGSKTASVVGSTAKGALIGAAIPGAVAGTVTGAVGAAAGGGVGALAGAGMAGVGLAIAAGLGAGVALLPALGIVAAGALAVGAVGAVIGGVTGFVPGAVLGTGTGGILAAPIGAVVGLIKGTSKVAAEKERFDDVEKSVAQARSIGRMEGASAAQQHIVNELNHMAEAHAKEQAAAEQHVAAAPAVSQVDRLRAQQAAAQQSGQQRG